MRLPILIAAAACLNLAACGSGAQPEAPTPSVLVSITRAIQGALPQTLTAYGSAGPSQTGVTTLSMAQPGQIRSLAVTPGTDVTAGQVLAIFTVSPSAHSTYLQAVDALNAARKQRSTTAQLLAQQLATTDQLAQADKALADARLALYALAAEGAGASVQTLRAPFSGVVTAVSVAPGDRTQPGAAIMTLAKAGGIVLTVGIDPSARGSVHPGNPAKLQRLSGGGEIGGQVLRIDDLVNSRTRLIDVDLTFPPGSLLPGEGAKATIETGEVTGWVVPHQAIVTAGGPARVFQEVLGKARAVPVRVKLATAGGDVVEGAIDPQAPIIVEGAYQVKDGDAVRRRTP